MSKMRNLLFAGLLLTAVFVGLSPDATAQSDTPCTDQFNACQDSDRSYDYCDGQFCGCITARYGGSCDASTVGHANFERSLAHALTTDQQNQ